MTIVEIDVTNRCPHQCSGCTRLVGHLPPRDMDIDTFKRAVDSLEDHPGMIGIIGGEPLLWPHFENATNYLVARTGGPVPRASDNSPVPDLTKHILEHYSDIHVRRGLFTSLPPNTIHHWEQILDSYPFIGINTHENAGLHQQFLVAGNELPISREQRLRMIQDCWVNKYWSCSITPQGCWPCEIMGTLAHAFDGPGPKEGWPIERGWWQRPPEDWEDMLKWCEICGAAMDVPRLPATSNREIVSPANYARLAKIGSKKIARGIVEVLDPAQYDASKYKAQKHNEWYLPMSGDNAPDSFSRIKSTSNLKPQKLECVMVCVGYSDFLQITLPWNLKHWSQVAVVTNSDDSQTAEIVRRHGARLVISDSYRNKRACFNKGSMINSGVATLDYDDWIMITDADILLPPDFRTIFDQHVWNPGTLYFATRLHTPPTSSLQWITRYKQDPSLADTLPIVNPITDQEPWGYFQLFHSSARALTNLGKNIYSENFTTAGGVDNHFMQRWTDNKKHLTKLKVIHIDHEPFTANWAGRQTPSLEIPSQLTGIIPNNGWTPVGWLDDNHYHRTLLVKPGGFLKLVHSNNGECVIIENRNLPTDDTKLSAHYWGIDNHRSSTTFEILQKMTLSSEDTKSLLQSPEPPNQGQ